jgi:PAS domain S-box-containing protein
MERMLLKDSAHSRLQAATVLRSPAGAALACGFALWLPAAWWLGSDAMLQQVVWAIWCAACVALLLRMRRTMPASGPEAALAPAESDSSDHDIVHAIPLSICVCALPGGEILFANDAMVDLAGEPRGSLLGRALGEFCAQTHDRERLGLALATGHGFDDVELPVRRADGTVRWLSVCGRPDEFAGRAALFVVCHDVTVHKQAQRSLIASEERFRLLLGALSESVVLYDAQARVLTRNRAAEGCTWLDDAHASLPGGHAEAQLFDEQGRVLPNGRHPVMRSLNDGQPLRDVVIGTGRAGSPMRWLSLTTQPLFHAGASRPYAVVASYSDLTARIRAERALRASEQRYALALRGMNEGLAEWINGSEALYVSPRLSQIMGYDGGGRRMPVQDFVAGIHPADKQGWDAMMDALLGGGHDVFQLELRMRHADGSYHWFMVRGVAQRDAAGRSTRVVGTIGDISLRKRLEQVDLAERDLLARIAAGVPLADVTLRLAVLVEGLLHEDSRVAVLTCAASADDSVDVVAPRLSAGFRAALVRLPLPTGTGSSPLVIADLDVASGAGAHRAALADEGLSALWALPLAGPGGIDLGVLVICHRRPWRPGRSDENLVQRLVDIAQLALERARGERQVRELNESLERRVAERTVLLEQANNELEAFSYSVSHDLRSPLRAINGFAHLLTEHAAATLDDEGRDMLQRIQRGSNRMGQLIDDILRFSRMARIDMAHADVRLDKLARSVAAELLEQYPVARITVAPLGQVSGDTAMLRQVFANLIGNALKFSAHAEKPLVELFVSLQDGEPAICVRDNGVGFDPLYADRLFGVFQRMHGAEEFSGTGVGLAIVKRIVERHGGRVSVQAAPGKGATFFFTLQGFVPAEPLGGAVGETRTGT